MKKFVTIVVCACAAGAMWMTTPIAAADDPFALGLLQFSDLGYLGSFRLPDATVNGDSFSYGGGPVAYNPQNNSLFIGSGGGRVAEVSIPAPSATSDINALPFASILQGFSDPTEGMLAQVSTDRVTLDGMLVYGDRLYGAVSIYYDANNTQRVSHFSRSTNLSASSFSGWSSVWRPAYAGFVSGFMALVPSAWQGALGGPAVTGQCCVPIAWRTSWGPAAFAFNPVNVGQSTVAATPLLYYPPEHPTLGSWDSAGPMYGGATQVNGVALVAGTRTALFIGRNGTGPFCYGNGTGDRSLVGTRGSDNEIFCYDPVNSAKGQHSYPYEYQLWAYDMKEFAAVAAGSKQAWEVVPYGVWPFAFPFAEPKVTIGGMGYDSSRQILYVSQLYADRDGYGYRPLIHALRLGGAPGLSLPAPTPVPAPAPTPAPPVVTTPPPAPSPVSSVTMTATKTAPQTVGSTITFNAAVAGGVAPYQYKWSISGGGASSVTTSWTSSAAYAWTPTVAAADYRISVGVRSAGSASDAPEASASSAFEVVAVPASTVPNTVSEVSLRSDKPEPQPIGSVVKWTATPVGGVAPHQYKWFVSDGSTTSVAANWSTTNSFSWTPSTAKANQRVSVWVRSAGNSADQAEAAADKGFNVIAPPEPAPTPAPPAPAPPGPSVTLTPSKASPQPAGTPVTFTVQPVGLAGPYEYEWSTFEDSKWTVVSAWSSYYTMTWWRSTPGDYQVAVRVRSAGSTVAGGEAQVTVHYVLQ
jgi:hypothetical protein